MARSFLVGGVVALAAAMSAPVHAQDGVLGKEEVEAIVRDYLLANPEIVRDALEALEEKATAAEAAQRQQVLDDRRDLLENSETQIVLGNPEGSVTLVEFFDYNCGYCKRALGDMLDLMAEDPDLRVVMKEFPVLGPGSLEAARVSMALTLAEPDKYLAFHERLLSAEEPAGEDTALAAAEAVGADMDMLRLRLEDPAVLEAIRESYSLADALGLNGTPSYVVGDSVIVGAQGYDTLKDAVDTARESEG